MRHTPDPRFEHTVRDAGGAGTAMRGYTAPLQPFDDPDSMVAAMQPSYPVYCVRPHMLAENARRFLEGFPGLVMYAVKCNPHPAVLHYLYEAGIRHFDTASLSEIAVVRENLPEAEAYFMHPVKARAALISASKVYDVSHYVIDHADELAKIAESVDRSDIDILVRLSTPGADVLFELSRKFGAPPDDAARLLRLVHEAGYRTGLAFHVGSQCGDPNAYRTAMDSAAAVIRAAGVPIGYLDVGGGFPANYDNHAAPPLEDYFAAIARRLDSMPVGTDCTVMCEPGRALVANAISLVAQVHLRRGDALYINDGIFHSMNEPAAVGIRHPARMIRPDGSAAGHLAEFTIYGPTCDSTDVIPHSVALPADIGEGDWIEFGQMGAYSNAMSTRFNGFHPETFVAVKSPPFRPVRND